MTRSLTSLLRRSDGSAAVEFAVAIPVLILMVFGMFQLGIVFQANAGMQHALGEAARLAVIYPTPNDAQLQARITAKNFGTGSGTWGTPTIRTDAAAGTKTINVTYKQPLDWIFFESTVTLNKNKVVHLSD